MAKASKVKVDIQTGTTRTVYATWNWTKDHTDHYSIKWYYYTGDGVAFLGSESDVKVKQATYSAPENAVGVKFRVKPVSKKHKKNKKEVSYWTADWSTDVKYSFKSNPPVAPSAPTVEINKLKLTASLSNLQDINGDTIEFQIVKNDKYVFKTGKATITKWAASYTCDVDAGNEYKVRARTYKKKEASSWSDYSSNVGTIPATPTEILWLKALSETSVQLKWTSVPNSTSCEIEYTENWKYFNSSSEVKSMTVTSKEYAEITGLESGKEWFFRVRAVNEKGNSGWTAHKSIVIGKAPSAPTTWSSTTTVITGEPLTLYWKHNAEDGSSEKFAELEMYIGGAKETHTIENKRTGDEKDENSSYSIDTSAYSEGTKIEWRVRTSGITNEYGDWSIQRSVDIYAPPTLELSVTDVNGNMFDTLASFPFYVKGTAGPATQKPIGYYLSVIPNESYETVDQIGNVKMVTEGEEVYSNFFDTSEELLVELSAGNIDLENNVTYTVNCTVTTNSGLNAESSSEFTVSWTDEIYEPDAEIGYDEETLSAYIHPYCEDENGNLIENITLSVYRREYNGEFVEIATGIDNLSNTFVTDPHPALDYARYRVVAISKSTGAVSYYDLPGVPVGESSIIIQWDEAWSNFDTTNEDALEEPAWSGSLLRLPGNIDVSDSTNPDVSLVEYIGRKYPVSYYGTQLGISSSWNADIPKEDIDTIYALRRLQVWTGDVYVREPSGSGYWANIKVSFSQKHCDVIVPVSLDVTRVSGGV